MHFDKLCFISVHLLVYYTSVNIYLMHGYGTCKVNRVCLRVIGLGILICTLQNTKGTEKQWRTQEFFFFGGGVNKFS